MENNKESLSKKLFFYILFCGTLGFILTLFALRFSPFSTDNRVCLIQQKEYPGIVNCADKTNHWGYGYPFVDQYDSGSGSTITFGGYFILADVSLYRAWFDTGGFFMESNPGIFPGGGFVIVFLMNWIFWGVIISLILIPIKKIKFKPN